ncbi:hypothetical protein MMC21_004732 [Puttea exsequens]|nr:hypothetical protein [Puttea exsequens]
MDKQTKYSLFPTSGASFEHQHRPQSSPRPHSPPAHVPSLPPKSSRRLNSSPPSEPQLSSEAASPTSQTSPENEMYAHCTAMSTTSSETSFQKPPPPQPHPAAESPPPRSRPKTVYIHNSIGGRGNYHKAIKEKENAPQSALRPVPRRSRSPRFLTSLFGKRDRSQGMGEREYEGGASLGAAEVLKRKMLGMGAGEGKRSFNGERS